MPAASAGLRKFLVLLLAASGASRRRGTGLRPLPGRALGMAGARRCVLLMARCIFGGARRSRWLGGVLHLLAGGVFGRALRTCAATALREGGRSDEQRRRGDDYLVHEEPPLSR